MESSSEHLILVDMSEKYWILWHLITDAWSNHTVWDVEISSENSRRDTGEYWAHLKHLRSRRRKQKSPVEESVNLKRSRLKMFFIIEKQQTTCLRNQIRENQREVSLDSDFDFISHNQCLNLYPIFRSHSLVHS